MKTYAVEIRDRGTCIPAVIMVFCARTDAELTQPERDQLDAARVILSVVTASAETRLKRLKSVQRLCESHERGSNILKPE